MLNLHVSPGQEVEFLVRTAQFDVAFQRHRVVSLHKWVEELRYADRVPLTVALLEVIAFQHARHRRSVGQIKTVCEGHGIKPFAVAAKLCLFFIKDFKDLVLECLGVFPNLLLGQSDPGFASLGRVADTSCEIADKKDGNMPKILKMF